MATLNTAEKFVGSVEFFLADGVTPATVQPGSIVWASSDETVIRVEAGPDGLAFEAPAVAPGIARLTVTADADLGDGVVTITGVSDDIEVTLAPAPLASVIRINLGAPVPKT